MTALLAANGLRVVTEHGAAIVDDVSVDLGRREILGIVGESGSGKTTLALALLGFARAGTRIDRGSVTVDGEELVARPEQERRRVRGRLISYVPQDAAQSLNPSLRVGAAIVDVARQHGPTPTAHEIAEMLAEVGLPADATFAQRLPHQLSGGQQQRVTIAMALSCQPPVIVMDEPTTGLDVITQQSVLERVRRLRDERDAAVVYVSHDLAVVSALADRLVVMYAGRIVEEGPTVELLTRPRHPYTRGLVESIPDHHRPARLIAMAGTAVGVEDRPSGCAFAPRCELASHDCGTAVPSPTRVTPSHAVRCIHHDRTGPVRVGLPVAARDHSAEPVLAVSELSASHRGRRERVTAATRVSFTVGPGECVALVGESGSGKTTIARCVAGLHLPDGGVIALGDEPLAADVRKRSVTQRRRLQYVFQNPFESLNPRRRVGDELARAAVVLRGMSQRDAQSEVAAVLDRVRLSRRMAERAPRQLSGGERQRVAIARALMARPDVLVCDEITSALDVSVQAAILEVLSELRDELGVAMLLITHDLGVVSVAADRVLVLERGAICEAGATASVLTAPTAPYTRRLLAAAPSLLRAPADSAPALAAHTIEEFA